MAVAIEVPPPRLRRAQELMQSLRIKFGERRSDWRCCFCCHVRTGTIFLGMYHFLINMLTLSAMAIVMRYPEYYDDEMDILPTPLSEVDDDFNNIRIQGVNADFGLGDGHGAIRPKAPLPHSYKTVFPISPRDWNISLFFTMCTLGLTLLLLYGAIKRKASYLMPFFGFQVFNFCITSMAAVGYLCVPPNLNKLIHENHYMPFKEELLQVNPQTLSLYAVLALLLAMMIKAYFIGVVWSCYKYLTLRQVATQRTMHFIGGPDNQTLIHDLPDYETAVKKFPTPPPSYASAVLGEGESSSAAMAGAGAAASADTSAPPNPWFHVRSPIVAAATPTQGAAQQV